MKRESGVESIINIQKIKQIKHNSSKVCSEGEGKTIKIYYMY